MLINAQSEVEVDVFLVGRFVQLWGYVKYGLEKVKRGTTTLQHHGTTTQETLSIWTEAT